MINPLHSLSIHFSEITNVTESQADVIYSAAKTNVIINGFTEQDSWQLTNIQTILLQLHTACYD